MTEDEAQHFICQRFGGDGCDRLRLFASEVIAENARQNLIAPSTTTSMWVRHMADSAQLVALAPPNWQSWLDVGTGAGFPGLVVAALFPDRDMTLAEPRARRAEFLQRMTGVLQLPNVRIHAARVETVTASTFDIVSARAVASSDELLRLTAPYRTLDTTYLLPRGRQGSAEVESLRHRWQGLFHVEQSITDEESTIIVANGVA